MNHSDQTLDKITSKSPDNGNTKIFEIVVLLKYLSNFWRNLEKLLINCEVNLNLTWSENCVRYKN